MKKFFTFLAVELVIGLSVIFLLFAQPAMGGSLTLQWTDTSNNEDGFKIERRVGTAPGAFVEIARTPANTRTYADAMILDNQTYCYRVKAFNVAGVSTGTNIACGTVVVQVVPTGPTGLTINVTVEVIVTPTPTP